MSCTLKDCAKNLISRLHDEFPAVDHGGVSAEHMKHRMQTDIGGIAQENLIGQVRSPQLYLSVVPIASVGMSWLQAAWALA